MHRFELQLGSFENGRFSLTTAYMYYKKLIIFNIILKILNNPVLFQELRIFKIDNNSLCFDQESETYYFWSDVSEVVCVVVVVAVVAGID